MNYDFRSALITALLLHAGVFFWVSWLPPAAAIEAPPPAARAVAFAVELPKVPPPAPPPPPPPPPPELVKVQAEPAPTPLAARPKQSPRPAAQKAAAIPAPLALSSVKSGPGAVMVERNETDVLGDPAVAVTPESLRGTVGAKPPEPSEPPVAEPAAPPQPLPAPVESVLVRAAPKSSCPVRWPEGLVMDRRTFAVRLLLTVDQGGRVMVAKVLRGAGAPFDQAAIDALRQCLFQPGTRDGLPVVDRVPFLVEFKPSDV